MRRSIIGWLNFSSYFISLILAIISICYVSLRLFYERSHVNTTTFHIVLTYHVYVASFVKVIVKQCNPLICLIKS